MEQAYKCCLTDLRNTWQGKQSISPEGSRRAISVLNYEAQLHDLQTSLGPLILKEDP
jgi:hypothetical protein